jgi:hypothetical protein
MLFGVAPTDVLTLVLSIAVITIVGLVGGILPAVRAAKTTPSSRCATSRKNAAKFEQSCQVATQMLTSLAGLPHTE